MPRFRDIPIKQKLTVIIMIANTVALLFVSAGLLTYEYVTFRSTMVNDLSTLAQIIGDRSKAALDFSNADDAQKDLNALTYQKHIVSAALYDKDGSLFAQYGSSQIPRRSDFPAKDDDSGFQGNRLKLFHKIYSKGDLAGTLYLESDLKAMNDKFIRYAGIISIFFFASWLVTLLLAHLLQRAISRPIFHLAETAKNVSLAKNYSARATKHGRDELGQLIDSFNEMLGQIQRRDDELQHARDELEMRVKERTQDLSEEILERLSAEEQLRQQFTRISLLNQITHAISERQDTESIFHVVLQQVEDHFGLDLGMVAFFDGAARKFNLAALRVKNSSFQAQLDLRDGSVVSLDETNFQLCEKGKTVCLPDLIKSPSLFSEKLAVIGWRSVVAVPLMVEEKLFGIMVFARLEIDGFSSGDCEFLRLLSDHVALAAHQAKLHQDLENAFNELRRTQATVLQQERLKALGQMASGVAHDVNNALSPVVGFSDLLLKGDYGLNAKGKKFLKYINTAGTDIAHIIARLREFYRRREDTELFQCLNLNILVEQVADMTRPRWRDIPQAGGVTIEMHTKLSKDIPSFIGIESEIREALTNLVLNAVDAMPDGGTITLRTDVREHLDGEKSSKEVVVDVSDTGMGMNEETQKRCLEPFFSTKGKRGTGLGLAMVYGVMVRHEGNVELKSAIGKGTTFRLIFPVREKLNAFGKEEELIAPLGALKILCIDDEPLLRELVKEMLLRDGHEVEVSDGGQAGLDQFRSARENGKPFDVVITDLGMPYLDGRQVAKIVKQESPQTPVVMLTGWGALIREDGSTPEQVDVIISKPPRSRELREVLNRFQPQRAQN